MSERPRPDSALVTHLAHASWQDNLLRGLSVSQDLAGKVDAWSLLSLSVGHRVLSSAESQSLDQAAVCGSSADPRIWPLKIVRLTSSYGSQIPAIVAGILCSDRGHVGWYQAVRASEFLADAVRETGGSDRAELERWLSTKLAAGGRAPGFGVPFRERDERVVALEKQLEVTGRAQLQHWRAAAVLDSILAPTGHPMNMGAGCAAVVLDAGFSPEQATPLLLRIMFANYVGNAVEGAAQSPEILRHLPDEFIEDVTAPPRESPRAAARRRGLDE